MEKESSPAAGTGPGLGRFLPFRCPGASALIELTRAAHYRQLAAQMRKLATQVQSPEIRDAYLSLAANWERLAEAAALNQAIKGEEE